MAQRTLQSYLTAPLIQRVYDQQFLPIIELAIARGEISPYFHLGIRDPFKNAVPKNQDDPLGLVWEVCYGDPEEWEYPFKEIGRIKLFTSTIHKGDTSCLVFSEPTSIREGESLRAGGTYHEDYIGEEVLMFASDISGWDQLVDEKHSRIFNAMVACEIKSEYDLPPHPYTNDRFSRGDGLAKQDVRKTA